MQSYSYNKTDITIIIPAKDECWTLDGVIKKALCITNNVIVVDDKSKDATKNIAQNNDIRVISGPGKGKGAVIKLAINNIKNDILVFLDADGSHNPEDIPELIQPILGNKADLVIASRFTGGSEELGGTFGNLMRLFGNMISTYFINLTWGNGKKLTDVQNGFKAIKRDVALQLDLHENSFAIEQEIVIKCLKKGFRIEEVPSYESKRRYGKSHLNPLTMLPKYIWCFIRNL